MKTLAFFLLAALAFTACQKEDDLARPDVSMYTSVSDDIDSSYTGISIDPGYCKDIQTEHALLGKGAWHVLDNQNTIYVLNAYGEAFLNNENVGRSELKLVYDPVTKSFSGWLSAKFDQVDIEHNFAGRSTGILDNYPSHVLAMEGETDLLNGIMSVDFGDLFLKEGSTLKISATPNPDGEVNISITIDGMFCTKNLKQTKQVKITKGG